MTRTDASGLAENVERVGRQVRGALGQHPVDLLLRKCRIVNPYAEEVHQADVAVLDGQIVAVRQGFDGDARDVVDCQEMLALPGFVEPQLFRGGHIGSEENAWEAVTHGTTTVFRSDPSAGRQRGTSGAPWRVFDLSAARPHGPGLSFADGAALLPSLRLGRTVVVSNVSESQSVQEILQDVVTHGIDTRHLCLGEVNAQVHRSFLSALTCGIDPVQAVQLASLNAATHYGVDHAIGSVTPGRWADILLVRDLDRFPPERVYIGGVLAATRGEPV